MKVFLKSLETLFRPSERLKESAREQSGVALLKETQSHLEKQVISRQCVSVFVPLVPVSFCAVLFSSLRVPARPAISLGAHSGGEGNAAFVRILSDRLRGGHKRRLGCTKETLCKKGVPRLHPL